MSLAFTGFDAGGHDDALFNTIAGDIHARGFSIVPNGLPVYLAEALAGHVHTMPGSRFEAAGIGRDSLHMQNSFVRSDEIAWINGETEAGSSWMEWSSRLQLYLNRRLFLGLFSFESHFAHYSPGDFYKRHYDAFRGEANRVLSLVAYLNSGWAPDDGGELVLYQDDKDQTGTRVTPAFGTIVLFLSEEFPHEVLPAKRDRYSIAGWFRLNSSTAGRVDPPA